jgi:hypothetical protein
LSSGPVNGFGESGGKSASVAGSVLAHVRSKLGNVTSRRTDAL